MNSKTSSIASAPSKGSATKTADANNAQARRKQESRNSEVSLPQRTTCSGTVGGKIVAVKLPSHRSIVNTTKDAQAAATVPVVFSR